MLDVGVSPLRWRHAVGHGGVFGGHAKRIPTHGHEDVVAAHAKVSHHDVVDRVIAHMAHVQLARRVGQHRAGVEFFLLAALCIGCALDRFVGVGAAPVFLGRLFDLGRAVFFLHDGWGYEGEGKPVIIPSQPGKPERLGARH